MSTTYKEKMEENYLVNNASLAKHLKELEVRMVTKMCTLAFISSGIVLIGFSMIK